MKLPKRFCGIVGTLALMAGRVLASDIAATPTRATNSNAGSQNQAAANDIAATIAREVPDRGYTVHVELRGGVATLRGTVTSPNQVHRILQAVRSRPSVKRVNNELMVVDSQIQTVSHQVYEASAAPMPVPQGQALVPVVPEYTFPHGAAPQYDAPFLPPFAWPARAPYPNYTAVQYPKNYSSTHWPHIGPFYPYPEPPLDWRSVKAYTMAGLKPVQGSMDPPPEWHCFKLRWDDGRWYLSFKEPWWAKRGFLNSLCDPQPEDTLIGCGTHMGCGYKVHFKKPFCTHLFTN